MKQGSVIWFCGLAGSGKSALAETLLKLLRNKFDNVVYLDGDETREFCEPYTDNYSKEGRMQAALKRARMADFLSKQGQIVVVSTISLFNEVYEFNRANCINYFEIFVECEFDELKRRDKKGLYTGALQGKIKDVVGVDIKFDEPKPNLRLDNTKLDKLDEKARFVFDEFMKFYPSSSLHNG